MALASPSGSRSILQVTDTATTGIVNYLFTIPQDADVIVCKFSTGTNFPGGTAGSANVYIQTTEDGGTTWRDTAVWAVTSVISNAQAHFQPIATSDAFSRGIGNWVGSVFASTLAVTSIAATATGQISGMPMMGTLGRVSIQYNGTISANNGVTVQVFAPSTTHSS